MGQFENPKTLCNRLCSMSRKPVSADSRNENYERDPSLESSSPPNGTALSQDNTVSRTAVTPQRVFSTSCFTRLPTELLQSIAKLLPITSAIAFTLCSYEFLNRFGTEYFGRMNNLHVRPTPDPFIWEFTDERKPTSEELDHEQFFSAIDQEYFLNSIYCFYCRKRHKSEETGNERSQRLSTPMKEWRRCFQIEWVDACARFLHDKFTFSRVQNLMKHYRHGKNCSVLLEDLTETRTTYREGCAILRSVKPRIVSGGLLVRTQHWMLLEYTDKPQVLPEATIGLCAHVWRSQKVSSPINAKPNSLDNMLSCRLSYFKDPEADDYQKFTGLVRCGYCPTEFQIDCKRFEDRRFMMVFTVWQDFGNGMSPYDPKWGSHFLRSSSDGRSQMPEAPSSFKVGIIKDIYETKEFVFDEHLTERMSATLKIKRPYSSDVICR